MDFRSETHSALHTIDPCSERSTRPAWHCPLPDRAGVENAPPSLLTIALFGTSADPPTVGHQQIIHWLSYQFDRVAVWASDNPFKTQQTPLQHRTEMLRLLIDAIQPARHNIEIDADLSSPRSLITVQKARQKWRDAQLTLVVGSDLVPQLPRWYQVTELLQQVNLLVVPRPRYPLEDADLNQLRQMGATVAIANLTGLPVSSTAYRQNGDPGPLIPAIQDYIHREQLYACQDGATENTFPKDTPKP